jgi:hypothetical protein
VPYSVWSRGRLIGHTDLGFIRLIDVCRSGSFHPTAEGARLMPAVASRLPAMGAYLHRDARDAAGNGLVRPELQGSALFADLAEAFQHVEALELEIRREDGSVVPTSAIGIQDTHDLIALAEQEMERSEDAAGDDSWACEDALEAMDDDRRLEMDIMHDMEILDGSPPDGLDQLTGSWVPEAFEEPVFPRYEIHVMLLRGDSIP